MKISLTAGQAVCIHGWWRARTSLTWGDVLLNQWLSFRQLLQYNLTEQDLFMLQPDLQAWVRAERVALQDCPRLRLWDAHPIRDFKADLADIISARWPPETLSRMGVGYQDLLDLGLTPETMALFNYTLLMWANVGFLRAHAEAIPPATLFRLFNMSKLDVVGSLK